MYIFKGDLTRVDETSILDQLNSLKLGRIYYVNYP